jgi:5-formaminoimidazole-4-carboxamide-1-(beta)-D-ribofuranosyl 5'-monophosphate synthetase
MDISKILEKYDKENITIGVLGGHSALDICHGAKKAGFKTLAVCAKGRDKTYSQYYKSREDGRGCIDDIIMVDHFKDIVRPEVQEELRKRNTIFIHNRYFWVYCNFEEIEKDFKVPIYGTREMLKLEERDVEKNQYYLLEKAGIRIPKIFEDSEEIDRLSIVKVNEAKRGYERAFFLANNAVDYQKKSEELIKEGIIKEESLKNAVIEEYIVGAHVNCNYFYSVIDDELELMGTDTRRQTNLDGLLRLPAPEQMELLKYMRPSLIETGHYVVTTKESILEKIFDIGEKFVALTKKELDPGMIGPFALQGAVSTNDGKEEIVIFDVSMRIPGSPGTKYTPYSSYLWGQSLSYGERVAIELRDALDQNRLPELLT